VLVVDHQKIHPDPTTLASYIILGPRPLGQGMIAPQINVAVRSYISSLIAPFDRAPQEPQFNYDAGKVSVVAPARNGLAYADDAASSQFEKYFQAWTPGKKIHVQFHTVKPAPLSTNPASLGIKAILGEGSISLAGSPPARQQAVAAIAKQLNFVLIQPNTTISFNQDVNEGPSGTGWPQADYDDAGTMRSGHWQVGAGGAMQAVATAFFGAGYAAGLPVVERHAHPYLPPWVRPAGMDAVVSPSGNDVQFDNDTSGYVLIQARYEPIQRMLYIYFYGRPTGWTVSISSPKLLATVPAGPAQTRYDASLAPDARELISAPVTGYRYQVTRVVTDTKNGKQLRQDALTSVYGPRPAVYLTGSVSTPTPTPTPTPTQTTPPSTPTPVPTAEPTATGGLT
jgi:vancomycin resistance protein YoaR